jgi:uncharacterized protein YegL
MGFMDKLESAAQRQQLRHGPGGDPLYRQLSYLFTLILRNLYPVRVLCGPQVSPAPPAACDISKALVYLDLDPLLGNRAALERSVSDRAVTGALGVGLHEVGHAKHTLVWVAEELHEHGGAIARDAQLLEEPRMEAHLMRDFEPNSARARFLATAIPVAVADHILPRLVEAIGKELLTGGPAAAREAAATSLVYTWGRVPAGTLQPSACAALEPAWDALLGPVDTQALKDLMRDVVTIADTDVDAMVAAATRYREIVGEPPSDSGGGDGDGADGAGAPDGSGSAGGQPGDGSGGSGGAGGSGGEGGGDQDGQSLADRMQDAIDAAQQAAAERLQAEQDGGTDIGKTLQGTTDLANRASEDAKQPGRAASEAESYGRVGLPAGGKLADRGVDRPPTSEERRFADELARQLQQARVIRRKVIQKRMPGGRFDSRAAMRASAQRIMGQPVTAHPWSVEPTSNQRLRSPHVLLIVDTSGSMSGSRGVLGSLCWTLDNAIRQIDGTLAITAFGDGIGTVHDGRQPLKLVPDLKTNGGTSYGAEAIDLGARYLELEDRHRPRAIYILSDGGWSDSRSGVETIKRYAENGVPTIHLSIGVEPLGLQASEIVVIKNADDAAVAIADRTAAALAGTRRR